MRLVEGREIGDLRRVEYRDVGVAALRQATAILQLEARGGQARQAPNRVLQRRHLLIAHIAAQEARKRAVSAWMRVAQQERPFRRRRLGVRADVHPRLRQAELHVVFGHQEVRRADTRVILDHEIDRGILGRNAAHLRDLGERLAGQRLELLGLEADQQHALRRAGGEQQALPLHVRVAHLGDDFLADIRLLQLCDPAVDTALLHPRRHRSIEPGRSRRVCIHVRRDRQTLLARGFDLGDGLSHLRPVLLTRGLQVISLRMYFALARDTDQLVERFEKAIAFAAHVRDVAAAELTGSARERDQFFGLRIRSGCVDEGAADAERAFAHRLAHQLLHMLQLGGRGRTVVVTYDVLARGGRADK